MIYTLPVVLAKNAHDKESVDYILYRACNNIYKHDYRKALQVLNELEYFPTSITLYQKELFMFNKGYCYFKLDSLFKAQLLWQDISFYSLQILARFNLTVLSMLNADYKDSLEHLDYCI